MPPEVGTLLPGGLHLTVFVIIILSLDRPSSSRMRSSIDPALPTKGLPSRSSFFPGASPTKHTGEERSPSGGTTLFLVSHRGQRLQSRSSSKSVLQKLLGCHQGMQFQPHRFQEPASALLPVDHGQYVLYHGSIAP